MLFRKLIGSGHDESSKFSNAQVKRFSQKAFVSLKLPLMEGTD
jgi:hypothetical protein